MKLPVRIAYHKPFLPTPRCKKYRYERQEELVELELPEAPASKIIHVLDIFQREYGMPKNGIEKPWDVIRTRIYRRTVDGETSYYREATGKDIHNGISYDETINPFRGLAFRMEKGDRFVLYNQTDNRDFLIDQAKEYLGSFLLADGVLYKKTMAPAWRVHVLEGQYAHDNKSSVRVDLAKEPSYAIPGPWVKETEFPWYAKDDALAFAEQERERIGADAVRCSRLERAVPVTGTLPATLENTSTDDKPFIIMVEVNGGNVSEVALITDKHPANVQVDLIDYDNADAEGLGAEMEQRYEELTNMLGYVAYL